MKKISIQVEEPLILDFQPGISNEHETLEYIPATRLRGAFFEAINRLKGSPNVEKLLGLGGARWTCAWPAKEISSGNHRVWVPLPQCLPMIGAKKNKKRGWGELGGDSLYECIVPIETHMSVSRHYGRRAHRDGALYARMAVSPGQFFVAYAAVDSSVLPNQEFGCHLGTRRSANGLCKVTVADDDEQIAHWTHPDAGETLAVQLLSDAIIPSPSGGYFRGLDAEAVKSATGCNIRKIVHTYSSNHVVAGWSGPWNLPRESAVAIERGSVWVIQFASTDDCRKFADYCNTTGLGIRGYEGFGWVVINPRWLAHDSTHLNYRLFLKKPETPSYRKVPFDAVAGGLIRSAELRARAEVKDRKTSDPAEVRRWISAVAREPRMKSLVALHSFLGDEASSAIGEDPERCLLYLTAYETSLRACKS